MLTGYTGLHPSQSEVPCIYYKEYEIKVLVFPIIFFCPEFEHRYVLRPVTEGPLIRRGGQPGLLTER